MTNRKSFRRPTLPAAAARLGARYSSCSPGVWHVGGPLDNMPAIFAALERAEIPAQWASRDPALAIVVDVRQPETFAVAEVAA